MLARPCRVFVVVTVLMVSASGALAKGSGMHVGAEAAAHGPVGLAVGYDLGKFRITGGIGLEKDGQTTIMAGLWAFYVLHGGDSADFSLGGGLGLLNRDVKNQEGQTSAILELGAQIRAFVAPSVALTARLGIAMTIGDEDYVSLGGDLVGAFGVLYFFQ